MLTRDEELDCTPFVGCAGRLSKTSSSAGSATAEAFLRGIKRRLDRESPNSDGEDTLGTTAHWGSCVLDANREKRGVGTALEVDFGCP